MSGNGPFVLLNTKHGTLIVNKNDYHLMTPTYGYGVGFQLINKGEYDPEELALSINLINSRLQAFGPGVVVVDCGANIGVFTTGWASALKDTGHVYAFEAQEKVFYALAGNVIIHNCLNVTARHTAVGAYDGFISFPEPDYNVPGSFGSFELKQREKTEDIGQPIDYSKPTLKVPMVMIDSLELPRLDFLKIDVEGMEAAVIEGATKTLERCKPQVFVELLKSDGKQISKYLKGLGYTRTYNFGLNTLFLHDADPLVIKTEEAATSV